jgi:hypothetical protein
VIASRISKHYDLEIGECDSVERAYQLRGYGSAKRGGAR